MGCGRSKASNPVQKTGSFVEKGGSNTDADIKVSAADFVANRTGNITDIYTFGATLGTGAFGVVKKAKHKKSGVTRAIKRINKTLLSEEEQKKLFDEVAILKNLDHPNILKVLETYEEKKFFYVVTEFLDGGELFDKITAEQYFSEKEAASTMKQILSAVNYCHKNKIIHRDLKPENILYESKDKGALLKLIDFGTSVGYDPSKKLTQRFGTPYYIAPEVLKRKYDEKCDVWSCGVIMYILLCGMPPFNGGTDQEIFEKVLKGTYKTDLPEFKQVSQEAMALLKKLLTYDPEKRISAELAMKDPWFDKILGTKAVDNPIAIQTLKNLKNFRAGQKLQNATWVFLVSYLSTKEEKADLLKTFQALDANGDGKLTREEIIDGYRNILGSINPEQDADTILKQIDNNNSGTVDYTEFVMATIDKNSLLSKERLETAFKMFDKDGNGFITADELREVFDPENTKGVTDNQWLEWIRDVDKNSDGKISLSEFKDMMLKMGTN